MPLWKKKTSKPSDELPPLRPTEVETTLRAQRRRALRTFRNHVRATYYYWHFFLVCQKSYQGWVFSALFMVCFETWKQGEVSRRNTRKKKKKKRIEHGWHVVSPHAVFSIELFLQQDRVLGPTSYHKLVLYSTVREREKLGVSEKWLNPCTEHSKNIHIPSIISRTRPASRKKSRLAKKIVYIVVTRTDVNHVLYHVPYAI